MQSPLTARKSKPDTSGLRPLTTAQRQIGPWAYMSMWLGDGFNIGNVTLGSSLVVAGIATLNLLQTLVAAGIAITLIALLFTLNDRFGYLTGAPYVIQLRLSFGATGAKFAGLLRAIPAIVWFGFQSWTGALALNQLLIFLTKNHFNNIVACFILLQILQVLLALKGFKTIKIVTSFISLAVMIALLGALSLILARDGTTITTKLIHIHGSWGLPFFGLIVAFLGNYTAIFESAADYSRELRPHLKTRQRFLLYFVPIALAYGTTLITGAMLAVTTGISSPIHALAKLFHNDLLTGVVSLFIVCGVITTNTVANIMPPAYVLSALLKRSQKLTIPLVGLLATLSCPWLLVQDSAATGLALFIKAYSIFLGPMTAIILLEFYLERHQQVNLTRLYSDQAQPVLRWRAPIALLIGAVTAAFFVTLSWLVGFLVGGLAYWLLNWHRRTDA